jgi:hypothetical protein
LAVRASVAAARLARTPDVPRRAVAGGGVVGAGVGRAGCAVVAAGSAQLRPLGPVTRVGMGSGCACRARVSGSATASPPQRAGHRVYIAAGSTGSTRIGSSGARSARPFAIVGLAAGPRHASGFVRIGARMGRTASSIDGQACASWSGVTRLTYAVVTVCGMVRRIVDEVWVPGEVVAGAVVANGRATAVARAACVAIGATHPRSLHAVAAESPEAGLIHQARGPMRAGVAAIAGRCDVPVTSLVPVIRRVLVADPALVARAPVFSRRNWYQIHCVGAGFIAVAVCPTWRWLRALINVDAAILGTVRIIFVSGAALARVICAAGTGYAFTAVLARVRGGALPLGARSAKPTVPPVWRVAPAPIIPRGNGRVYARFRARAGMAGCPPTWIGLAFVDVILACPATETVVEASAREIVVPIKAAAAVAALWMTSRIHAIVVGMLAACAAVVTKAGAGRCRSTLARTGRVAVTVSAAQVTVVFARVTRSVAVEVRGPLPIIILLLKRSIRPAPKLTSPRGGRESSTAMHLAVCTNWNGAAIADGWIHRVGFVAARVTLHRLDTMRHIHNMR